VETFEQVIARLGFIRTGLPGEGIGSAEATIRFLIGCLTASGLLQPDQAEEAVRRVLARERLGSTAIGRGVALPHATTTAVKEIVGIAAQSDSAVTWGGPGSPVQQVCLILAPPDRPSDYLRVLEALSRSLRGANRSTA
jgi:mannitol/fructose-specific phosphotransferase system IIA component (Ntr-type)